MLRGSTRNAGRAVEQYRRVAKTVDAVDSMGADGRTQTALKRRNTQLAGYRCRFPRYDYSMGRGEVMSM